MANSYHQSLAGVYTPLPPGPSSSIAHRPWSYASVLSGLTPSSPPHPVGTLASSLHGPVLRHLSVHGRSPRTNSQSRRVSAAHKPANQELGAVPHMAAPGGNLDDGHSHHDYFVPSYLRHSKFAEGLRDQHHRAHIGRSKDIRVSRTAIGGLLTASSTGVNYHKPVISRRGMTLDLQEKLSSTTEELLTPLPVEWDATDKHPGIEVISDGSEVKFNGTSKSPDEAAACRSDSPIPKQCGIYYFEVTIMNKNKECQIGIGLSGPKVTLNRLPGWEPDSWAYHSDDGYSFSQTPSGKAYGPKFSYPDVIGCGINFTTNTVFYTRNGLYLGTAFRDIKAESLHPAVGMQKSGEHVKVNFGQHPFVYDIDGFVTHARACLEEEISKESISQLHPRHGESSLMPKLIAQYLSHEGYVETAKLFSDEMQTRSSIHQSIGPSSSIVDYEEDTDAIQRQRICAAVLGGDMDKALYHTKACYPRVFVEHENIYFRLRCRKFIEMIRLSTLLQPHFTHSSLEPHSRSAAAKDVSRGASEVHEDTFAGNMNVDGITGALTEATCDADGTPSGHTLAKQRQVMDEALLYGQELRQEFKDNSRPETRKELEETFALIAYPDARDSVLAPMLDVSGRRLVAEELSSAILVTLGKSSTAAIERVLSQSDTLVTELSKTPGPASLIHVRNDYIK